MTVYELLKHLTLEEMINLMVSDRLELAKSICEIMGYEMPDDFEKGLLENYTKWLNAEASEEAVRKFVERKEGEK